MSPNHKLTFVLVVIGVLVVFIFFGRQTMLIGFLFVLWGIDRWWNFKRVQTETRLAEEIGWLKKDIALAQGILAEFVDQTDVDNLMLKLAWKILHEERQHHDMTMERFKYADITKSLLSMGYTVYLTPEQYVKNMRPMTVA